MIWPLHAAVETVLFGILFVYRATIQSQTLVSPWRTLLSSLWSLRPVLEVHKSHISMGLCSDLAEWALEVFPFPVLCQLEIELPFKVALMSKIVYVKSWKNLKESISNSEWSRWRNRALSPHSPPLCAPSCSIELLSWRVSGSNLELGWVLKCFHFCRPQSLPRSL